MRINNHSTLLYVGSGNHKTQLHQHCELPKILKDIPLPIQQPSFTQNDVVKVIEHILRKGTKYLSLRKQMQSADADRLEKKILNSYFVQFAVRKVMTQMGDERRLGAGLRGFSRLILEELEHKCWSMIQIQAEIMLKEFQEQQKRQKVIKLLTHQSSKVQST